jgi:hypothetical protein
MKIIKSLFAFATFFSMNSASALPFDINWPQIKAYHEIISKNYKRKEVNLKLIKLNSKVLLERADNLCVESMPEVFRNPKMIETLLTLKKNTIIVHDLVETKASDVEIKSAFNVLHETFNKIIGLCITEKK